MNKYSNASDFTSIFIPRVFVNITKERITHIVENVVPLGNVERIDMVEIDEKTNRVWVHFTHWYDTEFVNEFKKLLLDETKQAKIVYDDPWFWIVLKNTHRLANGQPKIRLNLEDGEISTPEIVSGSPKSTVTFTTSSSFTNHNPSKKFGEYKWSDVESDSDEEITPPPPSSPSSIQSQQYFRPISPPCPPPYPNPHYFPQIYQVPFYPVYYHAPTQFPYYGYNHVPIAPTLFIPPHPVASWNGASIDDAPFYQPEMVDFNDEIKDDAFLTEMDYQEMLLELDADDIYSDEDLYNMYLIEKEELALINQKTDDPEIQDYVNYMDVYATTGTGFDEETITFHEHNDAPLSSDKTHPDILPKKTQSHIATSLSKFVIPILTLKEKINTPISSPTLQPLKSFVCSYKDMLTSKVK